VTSHPWNEDRYLDLIHPGIGLRVLLAVLVLNVYSPAGIGHSEHAGPRQLSPLVPSVAVRGRAERRICEAAAG
jgi:hypothetical protein